MNRLILIRSSLSLRKFLSISLIFLQAMHLVSPSTISKQYANRISKPEIWLSGYIKEDSYELVPAEEQFQSHTNYENDFVSKRENDFVIAAETTMVIFTCEASYPITWKFPYPKQLWPIQNSGIKSIDYRISDFANDFPMPVNTRFKIVLRIPVDRVLFLSLNVTCISTETSTLQMQSSVYLYLADKSSLEFQGQTLTITAEAATHFTHAESFTLPPLVIPCRPSSPTVNIALERQHKTVVISYNGTIVFKNEWARLRGDNYGKFDPKIGFTFDRARFRYLMFGLYRCSVMYLDDDETEYLDSEQYVLVNVTRSSKNSSNDSSAVSHFDPNSNLYGKTNVKIRMLIGGSRVIPRSEIVCCSGVKNKLPKLYTQMCDNTLICEINKNALLNKLQNGESFQRVSLHGYSSNKSSSDCVSSDVGPVATVAFCKGENDYTIEEFVQIFDPKMEGPVQNRPARILADYLGNAKNTGSLPKRKQFISLSKFETVSMVESGSIAERMTVIVGRSIATTRRNLRRIFNQNPIEFNQVNDKLLEAVDADSALYYTSRATFSRPSALILREYNRDVYYEGEKLHFMCFGVKRFYANGAHMALNWKNGTKTILEPRMFKGWKEKRFLLLSGNAILINGWGGLLVDTFGRPIVAHQQMSSVDCWMPNRNGSGWDKISKDIQVLPSVAPKFAEKETEIVYFYVGDVGKSITCTVVDGVPFPRFSVTNDGHVQTVKWVNSNNNNTKSAPRSLGNGTRETGSVNEAKHLLKLHIDFDKGITHDEQTVWQCIARNVNGTTTRTITVYVMKRPGIALPISLGIAGVLSLIAIGLGLKYWHGKRNMKSVQTRPQ